MDLKNLVSIPGKPGLYRIVSQVKSATIVESLVDKSKFPIYMSDKALELEGVAIYTQGTEVLMRDEMDIIYKKESGGPGIEAKSDPVLVKKYFEEILPDYDKDKVYLSDMKKVLNWYNFLQSHGLIKMEENPEVNENPEVKEDEKPEETK